MPYRHRFKGKVFKVHTNLELDGLAVLPGDEPKGNQEIIIDSRLRGQRLLETTLHEALHASQPDLPEGEVSRTGRELALLLWKLGYRGQQKK